MPLITYIYLATILIAFISSLISFRLDFPFHLRLFSCLLGLTVVDEVTATLLAYWIRKPNHWVYNSYTLIEFCVYGYFFRSLLAGRNTQRLLLGFLFIFPIFWCITVFFIFGFTKWNSYVVIVGSFFTVVFCLLYYYRLLTAHEIVKLRHLSEFWIVTGMLIFYMAELPYFGALNYLIAHHEEMAEKLMIVLQSLGILMYLLFTYGYLCRIRKPMKS